MKIELTLNELSSLAADNLFLAKEHLKNYIWFKNHDPENVGCEIARGLMLSNFKMYHKLRNFYMN